MKEVYRLDLGHINKKVIDNGGIVKQSEFYGLSEDVEDETMSNFITTHIIQEGLGRTFNSYKEAMEHLVSILDLFPRLEQEDVEDLAMFYIYQVQEG